MNKWGRLNIMNACESIIDCVNKTAPVIDQPTPYKMIRTTNVKSGWVDIENVKYVTEEIFKKWTRRQVPKKGDVILTREAPLGEVGMLRTDDQVFLGQRLVCYRTNKKILNNKFLLYAMQTADMLGQITSFGSGSTVTHMRVPDTKRLTVLAPHIELQNKIASVVSNYEDLIENNQKRIKILEEMAQRLYSEWFVKFKFPGHVNVKMIESNREFGAIPQGWKIELLKDHIKIVRGKSYSSDEIDTNNGKYYLVNLKSFNRNGGFRFDGEKYFNGDVSNNQRLNTGDIVIAVTDMTRDRAVIARPARIPKINHDLVTLSADVVKIVSTTLLNSYLFFLLLDDRFTESTKAKANGANVLHLKPNLIGEYLFVLPRTELMRQFENVVQKNIGLIDCLNKKNDELLRTRDLLIKNIVTGKLPLN